MLTGCSANGITSGKRGYPDKHFSCFFQANIHCGHSLEAHFRGASNGYQQHNYVLLEK